MVQTGKDCPAPVAQVTFDISGHPARIAMVEALKGRSGWLVLQHLGIESFEREEHLLFSALDDTGQSLDQETCERLFHCRGTVAPCSEAPAAVQERLDRESDRHARATITRSLEENSHHFAEARERLEKWADDMVIAAEKELKDTKEQINALSRQARLATTVEEQHQVQEKVRDLEKKKRRQRQRIFDVEDEIMEKRDALIEALERRMQQRTSAEQLFTIRWRVA